MPTEAIGIREPMLTEHLFGLGVAWRVAGRPMGAFYPFLSGRDSLRAAVGRRPSRREPGGFLPGRRGLFV